MPPRPAYEPPALVSFVIFLLVTLIFFWPHLAGSAFLWEDFREFTYPNWVFAARTVAHGVVPYWNPYTFNGMPFTADLQVGYYYPLNQLLFILSGDNLGIWWAQFVVIAHYPIAMIGMWLLARSLGLNVWGATLSGVAFGLTGMLVVHMIHANVVEHLGWFPMIVYFYRRAMVERQFLPSLLSGMVLGVAFLSGHPQSSLYIVLFLAALATFELVRAYRTKHRTGTPIMLVLYGALPIIVGAGIFAVQVIQSQELAALSERAEMPYQKTLEGKLTPGQILTLVTPKYFGVSTADAETSQHNPYWYPPDKNYYYWETAIYFGVVVLVLGIVGVLSRRLASYGIFFAIMGLVGLLYALGDSFLIHPILGRLPLFSSFRIPTRMAIFLSLGASVLAGAGLDRLTRGEVDRALARRILVAGLFVVAIAFVVVSGIANVFFSPPDELAGTRAATGTAALFLTGAATLVAFLALRGSIPTAGAGVVSILLAIIDLFAFGYGQNLSRVNPADDVYKVADASFANYAAHPPERIFRVKMREGGEMLMPRNQGLFSGIMLYEGYNPLLLARRVPPTGDLRDRSNLMKALDLLDVRYDVGRDSISGHVGLVPRATAYPHARLVYNARVVRPDRVREAMADTAIDFGKTVVLEQDPGRKLPGNGAGEAVITSYDASKITVTTESSAPAILVLSEIWYPSWKVAVDGTDADLLICDYSLRGVAVGRGRHVVEFRFESETASLGWTITCITAVLSIVALALLGLRMRRKETGPKEPKEQRN